MSSTPELSSAILLLNLPASAFCGIDLLSFTTSPRFHGIKHLPPGFHLVFTGVTNSFSLRHAAWFRVAEQHNNIPDLHVKVWNAQNEELLPETDPAEVLRWRANLGSLWREGLTPYRQTVSEDAKEGDGEGQLVEEKADWRKLTDCISETLLDRITGTSIARDHWALTSASSAKQDIDVIPGITRDETSKFFERDLGFLPIDLKHTWREGAVGRERTLAAKDRSWALSQFIETVCDGPMDVVGELQFCFVSLLTLNNNSCLEQWKRLLSLMLTCQDAVQTYPELFVKFLATLRLQLEHCQDAEGGLFDMREEGSTLLKPLLKRFRAGMETQSGTAKADIIDELDEVEEYLRAEHGWLLNQDYARHGTLTLEDGEQVMMDMNPEDEDEESGDYAPLMVELTEEQARELGIEYVKPVVLRDDGEDDVVTRLPSRARHPEPDSEEEETMDLEDMDARY
jgi:A1 cistron-splicing factor AAR2